MEPHNKSWKKILYENNDFPDNYTDASFLTDMRKNIHIKQVTFYEAVKGASLVTQQFSIVVLFVLIFIYLYNDWSQPKTIFIYSSLLCASVYTIYIFIEDCGKLRHFRAVVMYLTLGYIVAPVLKTLTETISTDTIFSTTSVMMAIHLIFFDYGVKVVMVSSSLSLNAAIFGSLCLASRLPTPLHVFVLLTASVECFALSPVVLSKIGQSNFIVMSFFTVCSNVLYGISFEFTILFIVCVLFVNIFCPYLFVRWQTYKDNIYGPWDEAIVKHRNIKFS